MVISGSTFASLVASVGILPLMELNVPYQLLSRVLMRFIKTTVEPTPTFTSSQIGGYCEGFGKGTICVGLVVGD